MNSLFWGVISLKITIFPALLDMMLVNRYIIKHYAIKKTGEYSPASMLTHGYADVIMGILDIKE